jgi:motility quorum-sensing regulator / GCU-specific mRNA interferase toxin
MTEKRRPSYHLEAIKRAFATVRGLHATTTALNSAFRLGFSREDIIDTVQRMQPKHFHKSMTSFEDHRSWQDVYHVPSDAGLLYVKFTADVVTEFRLLSFKEK